MNETRTKRHRDARKQKGDSRLDLFLPADLMTRIRAHAEAREIRVPQAIESLLADALQLHGYIDPSEAVAAAAMREAAEAAAVARIFSKAAVTVAAVANKIRGCSTFWHENEEERDIAEVARHRLPKQAEGELNEDHTDKVGDELRRAYNRLLDERSADQWIIWSMAQVSGRTLLRFRAGMKPTLRTTLPLKGERVG